MMLFPLMVTYLFPGYTELSEKINIILTVRKISRVFAKLMCANILLKIFGNNKMLKWKAVSDKIFWMFSERKRCGFNILSQGREYIWNTRTHRNFPRAKFWISAEWGSPQPLVWYAQEPRGRGFIARGSWRGSGWWIVDFLWRQGGSWRWLLVDKPVFVPFHKNVWTEVMDHSLISIVGINVGVLNILSSFSFQFWPLWHFEFWRLDTWIHRSGPTEQIRYHTALSYCYSLGSNLVKGELGVDFGEILPVSG